MTSSISLGSVRAIRHGLLHATMPKVAVGDLCTISCRQNSKVLGQVITVDGSTATIVPFSTVNGVVPGSPVETHVSGFSIEVTDEVLGKVVDCLGRPLADSEVYSRSDEDLSKKKFLEFRSKFPKTEQRSVCASSPQPLTRQRINSPFFTSISTIDSLCRLARGQRVAIMASAGVGKSTLLGMIAKNAQADVVVVALVGERGREVREFLDECLGKAGLSKSVVVVSTSDEPPLARQLAAQTATTIAEYFRDKGLSVLLIVDSLTRVARAMRETGLATGELPVRHGYPNSVYTELPRLLERAGPSRKGFITGIYTLLASSDNDVDPLAEEVKSLLDGHIILSESMVILGVRPAIDPVKSISRLATQVCSEAELLNAAKIKRLLVRASEIRQLLLVGVDKTPEFEAILQLEKDVLLFLGQNTEEYRPIEYSSKAIHDFAIRYEELKS